ncbi:hypothetical protein STENM327S_06650 [Streptomyces tendae]
MDIGAEVAVIGTKRGRAGGPSGPRGAARRRRRAGTRAAVGVGAGARGDSRAHPGTACPGTVSSGTGCAVGAGTVPAPAAVPAAVPASVPAPTPAPTPSPARTPRTCEGRRSR